MEKSNSKNDENQLNSFSNVKYVKPQNKHCEYWIQKSTYATMQGFEAHEVQYNNVK